MDIPPNYFSVMEKKLLFCLLCMKAGFFDLFHYDYAVPGFSNMNVCCCLGF